VERCESVLIDSKSYVKNEKRKRCTENHFTKCKNIMNNCLIKQKKYFRELKVNHEKKPMP